MLGAHVALALTILCVHVEIGVYEAWSPTNEKSQYTKFLTRNRSFYRVEVSFVSADLLLLTLHEFLSSVDILLKPRTIRRKNKWRVLFLVGRKWCLRTDPQPLYHRRIVKDINKGASSAVTEQAPGMQEGSDLRRLTFPLR